MLIWSHQPFCLVSGRNFKITRSDDPSHTPLLQVTGDCLAGQTFRFKITSYGDFRNSTVWASKRCLRSCSVQYAEQYNSTDGFNRRSAVEISKARTGLASGVTMSMVMDQWWWLVEKEIAVHVQIMGSESLKLTMLALLQTCSITSMTSMTGYDSASDSSISTSYSLNLWIF